jgi:hypothetical protein
MSDVMMRSATLHTPYDDMHLRADLVPRRY